MAHRGNGAAFSILPRIRPLLLHLANSEIGCTGQNDANHDTDHGVGQHPTTIDDRIAHEARQSSDQKVASASKVKPSNCGFEFVVHSQPDSKKAGCKQCPRDRLYLLAGGGLLSAGLASAGFSGAVSPVLNSNGLAAAANFIPATTA